jgi:hypothetical protein
VALPAGERPFFLRVMLATMGVMIKYNSSAPTERVVTKGWMTIRETVELDYMAGLALPIRRFRYSCIMALVFRVTANTSQFSTRLRYGDNTLCHSE